MATKPPGTLLPSTTQRPALLSFLLLSACAALHAASSLVRVRIGVRVRLGLGLGLVPEYGESRKLLSK